MLQDFSWDEQGFSVMSRFYADMSLLLDDKFRVAKHMTYNYLGDARSVDTSPFRRAVWNYIQVRKEYIITPRGEKHCRRL